MRKILPLIGTLLLAAAHLSADTFVFATPTGATEGGLPVDAVATFDIGPSSMIVTVQNLETNPTSVDQGLAFITFDIAARLSNVSFTSSASQLTVGGNSPGDYSVTAPATISWAQSATGASPTQIALCDNKVGACQGKGPEWPAMLLLGGPDAGNAYSNANGSITTSSAHTPFLSQVATFTVTASGLPGTATSSSTISSVVFGFGTGGKENLTTSLVSSPVPEPGPAILLIGGLAFLALKRRHRPACA
jgi:hypothetical protein